MFITAYTLQVIERFLGGYMPCGIKITIKIMFPTRSKLSMVE